MSFKKKLLIGCYLLIFVLAGVMLSTTIDKIEDKKKIKEIISTKPNLFLLNVDSAIFSFPRAKHTVLIYFNTDCDHCQNEMSEIKKRINEFSELTLIAMSSEPIQSIKKFASTYQLDNHPNIHFVKIRSEDIWPTFGALVVPHIFIYDGNDNLVKEFKGEVKVDAMLQFVK